MTINLISKDNTLWAADEFIRYFSRMGNIEDYLRYVKKETVKSFSALTSFEDEFLNEDIHPNDMEFDIRFIGDRFQNSLPQDYYKTMLGAVSSHPLIMRQIFPVENCVGWYMKRIQIKLLGLSDLVPLQLILNQEIFG
jgi:hypothetical protein